MREWVGARAGVNAGSGAGSGQVRIGTKFGSNPDQERGRVKSELGKRAAKTETGEGKQKSARECGCNHTGRVATTAVITGLTTARGYNRGRNRCPRGCGCNQSLNLAIGRVSGVGASWPSALLGIGIKP